MPSRSRDSASSPVMPRGRRRYRRPRAVQAVVGRARVVALDPPPSGLGGGDPGRHPRLAARDRHPVRDLAARDDLGPVEQRRDPLDREALGLVRVGRLRRDPRHPLHVRGRRVHRVDDRAQPGDAVGEVEEGCRRRASSSRPAPRPRAATTASTGTTVGVRLDVARHHDLPGHVEDVLGVGSRGRRRRSARPRSRRWPRSRYRCRRRRPCRRRGRYHAPGAYSARRSP